MFSGRGISLRVPDVQASTRPTLTIGSANRFIVFFSGTKIPPDFERSDVASPLPSQI
ncbi:MAG: hypothetical protein HC865_17115 [Cyanobacteria bacterium RU_5_0]|nr:hypothetical protein [Cyanobacteria bacterium RU_5_0]